MTPARADRILGVTRSDMGHLTSKVSPADLNGVSEQVAFTCVTGSPHLTDTIRCLGILSSSLFLNCPVSCPKTDLRVVSLSILASSARKAGRFTRETKGWMAQNPLPAAGKLSVEGPAPPQEHLGTPPSPQALLLYFDIRSVVIKWDVFLIYWVKSFLPLLKNALLSPHRSWEFRKGINRQEFGSNRIFINTHEIWWGLKKNRIERADCQVQAQTYLETESEFISNGLFICFARTAARRWALIGGRQRCPRPGPGAGTRWAGPETEATD